VVLHSDWSLGIENLEASYREVALYAVCSSVVSSISNLLYLLLHQPNSNIVSRTLA
jgi:hypothetical protein